MTDNFNIDDYLNPPEEEPKLSPEKITPPLETKEQLMDALPVYKVPVYDAPITKIKDREPPKIIELPKVTSDVSIQTVIDWIRNIEREHILSFDAMMLKLESGLIPLNSVDHHWQPNETIAEEVLISFHEQDKEASLKEKVDEIIKKHTEGKSQEMAKYFVKMVEYREELMTPILALDSAFFTRLEEIDVFQTAIARKQLSLLMEIRDGIEKLNNN